MRALSNLCSQCPRSPDGQCVAISSMDGYCSIGVFDPSELGQPVPLGAEETAAEEVAVGEAAATVVAPAPSDAVAEAVVSAPSDETPVRGSSSWLNHHQPPPSLSPFPQAKKRITPVPVGDTGNANSSANPASNKRRIVPVPLTSAMPAAAPPPSASVAPAPMELVEAVAEPAKNLDAAETDTSNSPKKPHRIAHLIEPEAAEATATATGAQ